MTAEWVQAGPKRRSRIYHLTPEGQKQLSTGISEYRRLMLAIERVIQPRMKGELHQTNLRDWRNLPPRLWPACKEREITRDPRGS